MARLIDFHTNCRCGGDVHITADLNEEGYLHVETGTTGGRCGQDADAGAFLGNAMAVLHSHAVDAAAVGQADALDRANAKLAELCDAVRWLDEQLTAGDTIDASEVRERFGLEPHGSEDDALAAIEAAQRDAGHAADEAAAATTGPARPRPGRRGGG